VTWFGSQDPPAFWRIPGLCDQQARGSWLPKLVQLNPTERQVSLYIEIHFNAGRHDEYFP
jgi:hypothetical protein